jgi:hypothetical protein
MSNASEPTSHRISLIACLSRREALPAEPAVLEAWLTASGWKCLDASRWPWECPSGWDSYELRSAVRAQAQVTAARLLRKRDRTVGDVGPGAAGPGWAEGPHSRKQVTLAHALRLEGIDAVQLRAPGGVAPT